MALKIDTISKETNIVKAKFTSELCEHFFPHCDMREEIKIGEVVIYFRTYALIDNFIEVQAMFEILENREETIYTCILSSEKFKMKNQKFVCDDSQWRILFHQGYIYEDFKFDLTVELDVVKIRNPLAVLYDDVDLLDFELCANDGSVQFHSIALASASPVLRCMFTGEWKETKSRKLDLKDISKQTIQHFKQYLYLNVLPKTDSDIQDLMLLASYYMMKDLEEECSQKLIINAKLETIKDVIQFAKAQNYSTLYDDLFKLIRSGVISLGKERKILFKELGIPTNSYFID